MTSSALNTASAIIQDLQKDTNGFEKLAQILHHHAGIFLPCNPKNLSLMSARIAPILRERDLHSYNDYLKILDSRNPRIIEEFVNAMTTNTTEFFRESRHFDILTQLISDSAFFKTKGQNDDLRVWCAASSTGQEPYTILMTILEAIQPIIGGLPTGQIMLGPISSKLRMLATDIDMDVLEKASRGFYESDYVRNIPPHLQMRYFEKATFDGHKGLHVKDEMRNLIRFAPFNLVQSKYSFQHGFDYIFCRNVLIYFDKETVQRVVDSLARCLKPGGFLFLGHSESGVVKNKNLALHTSAVFKKVQS